MGVLALIDADHLVAVEPNFGLAYYVRGRARAIAGCYREAIADDDEALRRCPEVVYPLFACADSYERIGESQKEASDRKLANAKVQEKAGCVLCLDPFRYEGEGRSPLFQHLCQHSCIIFGDDWGALSQEAIRARAIAAPTELVEKSGQSPYLAQPAVTRLPGKRDQPLPYDAGSESKLESDDDTSITRNCPLPINSISSEIPRQSSVLATAMAPSQPESVTVRVRRFFSSSNAGGLPSCLRFSKDLGFIFALVGLLSFFGMTH